MVWIDCVDVVWCVVVVLWCVMYGGVWGVVMCDGGVMCGWWCVWWMCVWWVNVWWEVWWVVGVCVIVMGGGGDEVCCFVWWGVMVWCDVCDWWLCWMVWILCGVIVWCCMWCLGWGISSRCREASSRRSSTRRGRGLMLMLWCLCCWCMLRDCCMVWWMVGV